MASYTETPRVPMQVSRNMVVASIQVDLDEPILEALREDLLARIHETGSRAVILDVSGLDLLDSAELAALRRIMAMTGLMGAKSVLVGLRPGVVSALIEADADVDGLEAAVDLDAAYELLEAELEAAAAVDVEPLLDAEEVQEGALPTPSSETLEADR